MKEPRRSDVFRFKQFSVANVRSAQRIGTDGVLTGATAPASTAPAPTVWDVGAGTGLIALMAAQRFPDARIVAIELDPDTAAECRHNIAESPWAGRIEVAEGDVNALASSLPTPNLIVANPPFFASDTRSPDGRRALARNDGSLSPASLIALASLRLAPEGILHFIAPADRNDELLLEAELHRMAPVAVTDVASRADREPIRRLWTLMRRNEAPPAVMSRERIDIRPAGPDGGYSPAYRALTAAFYLDF